MSPLFLDVLRAATAVQVAVFELYSEDVHVNIAGPALDKCLVNLAAAVKRLRKSVQ